MSIMMTTMMMKVPLRCSYDGGGDDVSTADVASSSSSFSSLQRRKRRKGSFRSSSHSWHNNIHKTTTLSLLILLSLLLLLTPSVVLVSAKADDQSQDESSTSTSAAVFVHKTVIIPHDSKKHRGGEDSASTSDNILVVADGVGGWAKSGINPGLYSRELTKQIVHKYEGDEGSHNIDLKELVNDANWIAASKHKGSATCTVVELLSSSEDNGKSFIRTLNVGDSGYSIHRWTNDSTKDKLEVVFASEPGQKRFNFPFQLGGQYGHDVKEVGVPNQHTLQPNDIIIVYSDGVSDNLYPTDYHDCLLDGSIRGGIKEDNNEDDMDIDDEIDWPSLSWIADCIARQSYMKGKDKSFLSPFAIGAREAGFRKDYIGGKHDDITVTVAQVVDNRQIALERTNKDKYFDESVYLYEGHVKSKQYMPKVESIIDSPGRLVGVGGDDSEGEL